MMKRTPAITDGSFGIHYQLFPIHPSRKNHLSAVLALIHAEFASLFALAIQGFYFWRSVIFFRSPVNFLCSFI
jgi:hypothetical protein